MGEEEKKPEEKKVEEKKEEATKKPEEESKKPKTEEESKKPKTEEESKKPKTEEESKKPEEEKKTEEPKEPKEPPPPEPIVLKVYMHCEGCARKVRKCLKGFEGVENVRTDCKISKVIVEGKNADPLKVLEKVQKKCHRQEVQLLSPIPKPPAKDEKKNEENKEIAKPEKKKEEPPVIIVVLKVHMHCEGCAQEIQKGIRRMKGVEAADADLKSSQVTVKGVFDPPKLVEYVYKRTGKHAMIVKTEPEKKEEKNKEEKEEKKEEKEEKKGEKDKKGENEKKGEEKEAKATEEEAITTEEETGKVEMVEVMKNEFYYNYPTYTSGYIYPPAPQMFSDENPNACSVM